MPPSIDGARRGPSVSTHDAVATSTCLPPPPPDPTHTVEAAPPGPRERGAGPAELSPRTEEALAGVRAALSTDWTRGDVLVTEGEARQALAHLSSLGVGDFQDAVAELHRGGELELLLSKLGRDGRSEFLRAAANRGLLQSEAEPAPEGPLGPPSPPQLFQMNVALPRALNDAIHEHTRGAMRAYERDHDAYLGRYQEAVKRCTSFEDIRALGPPAAPTGTWELIDSRDPEAPHRYSASWGDLSLSSLPGYTAVSDRMYELRNERKPGEVWLVSKLEVKPGPVGFDLRGEGIQADARLLVKGKEGLGSHEGSVVARSDGTTQVGGLFFGGALGGTLERDGAGVLKKGSLQVGPLKVEAQDSRLTVELGLGMPGVENAKVGSKVSWDPREGVVRAGFKLEAPALKDTVPGVKETVPFKAELGVGVQLTTPRMVAEGLSSEGVFTLPEELAGGKPWEAFSEQRREELTRIGWDAASWARSLTASQAPSPEGR